MDSDLLFDDKATPKTLLRRASDLSRGADAQQEKANEGMDALRDERKGEFERRKVERAADTEGIQKATADLQGAMGNRPQVAMPNPHQGPPLDPQATQSLAWGIMGLSLVGAVAGRKHWAMATAALDGLLRGFKEGAEERIKLKAAEFKREFDTAIEKQRQANSVYDDILKSKTLSLNAQAEMMRIHAAAHQDWDMEAAARAKDFDGIYKRVAGQQTAVTRLVEQAGKMQERLDARAEKAAAKAAAEKAKNGGDGLSEKYRTDEAYKRRVDSWAKLVASGTPLPARFAQGVGKQMFADVMSAAPNLGTPEEMRAGAVEFAGQKSEARALGTRTAAIEQAASEAREMSEIVRKTSAEFSRTDWQPVNKVLAIVEKGGGGVAVRRLGASINSYINAYARAVNPSGVATVSDKEHAREMLSTADSPDQVDGILDILDQEMTAAQHSPRNVKRQLRNEITGGEQRRASDLTFASEADAAAAAKAGTLKAGQRITVNGITGTWQ